MDDNKISLQMEGPLEQRGDVDLAVFIRVLGSFRRCLSETSRVLSGDKSNLDFRVERLSHSSPSLVGVSAYDRDTIEISNSARLVPTSFFSTMGSIRDKRFAPVEFDSDVLIAYRDFVKNIGQGVETLTIENDGEVSVLDKGMVTAIDTILGPDRYEFGSVTGMLEQTNLHNNNIFTIYPQLPGIPKLKCTFEPGLRRKVISGIDKYVTVHGRQIFNSRSVFPYQMMAEDIEEHPDESKLPTLMSLRGIAPNATGGLSSEDFVRSLRNGW